MEIHDIHTYYNLLYRNNNLQTWTLMFFKKNNFFVKKSTQTSVCSYTNHRYECKIKNLQIGTYTYIHICIYVFVHTCIPTYICTNICVNKNASLCIQICV